MKFIYLIFCSFDSRDQWTLMLKKFYWPLLYCRNQREKNFFFYKIFRPIRIGEKIEFHYSIFYSLESRDQWTLILKKFYWPLLYCRNSREKIFFFPQNFSTNQNSRKMKFIYFIFCSFDSRDQWTLMLKKFYWPLLYCRNSARKKFFFLQNFSTNQNSRKNRNSIYSIFYSFESRDQWTLILKKFYWPLLYCRNSVEKIFFFPQNFSTNQNSRKNEFNYSIFFSFESRDQWTLMLKKFYWPLLYCRNQREKNFFFSYKIFRPIRIVREKITEIKSRKKFFFLQNFSTNQN